MVAAFFVSAKATLGPATLGSAKDAVATAVLGSASFLTNLLYVNANKSGSVNLFKSISPSSSYIFSSSLAKISYTPICMVISSSTTK